MQQTDERLVSTEQQAISAAFSGPALIREPLSALRGSASSAANQTDASGSEIQRRQSPRRRVLKGALIIFQKGHCSMRCQILDLSDTGALLAPSDVLLCPKEFVLKPDVGEPRNCEVMWRKASKLGVRFFD